MVVRLKDLNKEEKKSGLVRLSDLQAENQRKEGERYVNQMRNAPDILNPFKVAENMKERFSPPAPVQPTLTRLRDLTPAQEQTKATSLNPLVRSGVIQPDVKVNPVIPTMPDLINNPRRGYDDSLLSPSQQYVEDRLARETERASGNPVTKAVNTALSPLSRLLYSAEAALPSVAAFQRGAANSLGVESFAPPETGSEFINAPARLIGNIAGGAAGMSGAGIRPVAAFDDISSGVANTAGRMGLNNRIAQRALGGITAGAAEGASASAIAGQTDADEIIKAALLGAGTGGLLEGGGATLGQVAGSARQAAQDAVAGRVNAAVAVTQAANEFPINVRMTARNQPTPQPKSNVIENTPARQQGIPAARSGPLQANSASELPGASAQMARGITEGMYDALWSKVQKGDVTEGGQPSALLQVAKLVRDNGGIKTRDEFIKLATDVTDARSKGLTGKEYQDALRNVASKYINGQQPTNNQGMQIPVDTKSTQPTTARTSNKPGERAFNVRVRETEGISSEVQQGLLNSPDRFYRRVTNRGAVATANRRIERQGVESTAKKLLTKSKLDDKDLATGMRSIQELDKLGDYETAVAVASKMAKKLTEAGQLIQAASIWERLSPEGALLYIQRQVGKAGKEVTPQDASEVMSIASAAQKAGASVDRSNDIMDISDKLIKKEEVTPDEMAKISTFLDDMSNLVKPPKSTKTAKQPKLPSDKKVREQLLSSLNDKEAQLKAFIQQNSKRISANPVDVWGAYVALGAVKLAKGAISFSKWSEEMIRDAGDNVRPYLSKLFDDAQVDAQQLEHLMPPPNAAQKVAKRYIDMNRLTPADGYKIHRLAADMGKMGTRDKQAASRQMQEILNRYEKSTIGDKINALRYIAMLANTSTQLINAMSSPLMVLERYMLDMIQTPFDVARTKFTGGQRQITFKQGPGVWDNFFKPVADYLGGLKTGAIAGAKGIDPEGITSPHDVRGLAWKSKFNPVSWLERGLGAVMKGFDYASYNAAAQMKMRQMAYLDALNKGIKDKAEIKRYMDRYLNNVDSNIVELADKFGKEMTFQQDSLIADAGRTVQRGLNFGKRTGLGSAVLPFVKTPANILMAGLERTPAGLLKGIYDLATMRARGLSGSDVAATIAKSLYGTAALSGTGFVLGNLGIITGDSTSKSKDVQALEESIGQGKFKFNTTSFARMMEALVSGDLQDIEEVSKYRQGDKLLNYNKLQPIAFPVAMGATFAGQQRQAQAAEARGQNIPLSDQLLATAGAGAQSIYDMSMLKGLQDLFDVQPGEGILDIGTQLAANYVKSFSPSALGQEARRQDEAQRQVSYKGFAESVKQYFQSRTPGQSEKLPPKVTNLGDIKTNTPGVIGQYLNPLQSSSGTYNEAAKIIYDTIQATGDEKLAPTPMDKTIRGKKNGVSTTETIDPQRYAQLMQDVGKEVSRRIINLPKNLTPERRAQRIEEIYDTVREKERNKLKREMGFRVGS